MDKIYFITSAYIPKGYERESRQGLRAFASEPGKVRDRQGVLFEDHPGALSSKVAAYELQSVEGSVVWLR